MDEILIDPRQVVLQPGVRPREGASPGDDGKFADADLEVVVQVCVGCVKKDGGLLDATGNAQGVMVPVGFVSRSFAEVKAEALKVLGPKPALVAV